jgi:Sulfatase-modifying factor enzyme 1
MVLVPGGRFRMGSGDFYSEERPIHEVVISDLWVDEHPVTNAQFRRFVKATGHLTVAEQAPDAADFPGAAAADLVPGSLVSLARRDPSRLTTGPGGGNGFQEQTGVTPTDQTARLMGGICTRSCMWVMRMQPRTQPGSESAADRVPRGVCRPWRVGRRHLRLGRGLHA